MAAPETQKAGRKTRWYSDSSTLVSFLSEMTIQETVAAWETSLQTAHQSQKRRQRAGGGHTIDDKYRAAAGA